MKCQVKYLQELEFNENLILELLQQNKKTQENTNNTMKLV